MKNEKNVGEVKAEKKLPKLKSCDFFVLIKRYVQIQNYTNSFYYFSFSPNADSFEIEDEN